MVLMEDLTTTPTTPATFGTVATVAAASRRRSGIAFLLATALIVGGSGGAAAGYAVSRAVGFPVAAATAAPPAAQLVRAVTATGTDVVGVVNAVLPAVVTVINYLPNGQAQSSGSGIVIDARNGYVVTNSHVVENVRDTRAGASFDIVTSDDRTLHARLVGRDVQNDIAVLQVSVDRLVGATLADSAAIPVGATVVAIGSALGTFQNTVTTGVLSGKGRQLPESRQVVLDDLLQTDAAINQGNSGGPLIWAATSEVVGMNTLVNRQNGAQGLGFAISSNTIRTVVTRLLAAQKEIPAVLN